MLSARNQFPAVVKSVKLGNVMAEVVMRVRAYLGEHPEYVLRVPYAPRSHPDDCEDSR